MPPRQLAHPVFEPGDGLGGDTPAQLRFVPQRKAEERASPRSVHGALCGVDLKLEAAFDEAGHALHDPPAGLFRAHVDVAVIRVAHEPVAASLELAVQFIQHEVREQRRERPALRRSFFARLEPDIGRASAHE